MLDLFKDMFLFFPSLCNSFSAWRPLRPPTWIEN